MCAVVNVMANVTARSPQTNRRQRRILGGVQLRFTRHRAPALSCSPHPSHTPNTERRPQDDGVPGMEASDAHVADRSFLTNHSTIDTVMIMGRPRGFSEDEVLGAAAGAFVLSGYEGTSIDNLVKALNLHRGSLYQAFGSKHGLFLAALRHHIETHLVSAPSDAQTPRGAPEPGGPAHRPDLDLLLIAGVERGHCDAEVAALVRHGLELLEEAITDSTEPPQSDGAQGPRRAVQLLGARLYERLLIDPDRTSTTHELTRQEN